MRIHVIAVAQVLLLVGAVAASAWGWGRFVAKLLQFDPETTGNVPLLTWLGWSCTLLLLQLTHFFAPLTAAAVLPILAAGVLLAIVPRRERDDASRSGAASLPPRRRLLVAALLVAVAPWIASRAMAPPQAYDYGLYHHGTIQWINEFPAVPGLGNLHSRLAFNQSPLVYVASLNLHPHFGQGRVIAISFVTLLALASVLWPLLVDPGSAAEMLSRGVFERNAALFLLPLATFVVVARPEFSSPSPDLFSTVLQIAIFLLLCRGLDAWRSGRDAQGEMPALAVLAATAITVKLSNLAFAAAVLGIAVLRAFGRHPRGRSLWSLAALPAIVLLTWFVRGVVLSGMPFFPSTALRFPVDWAVPSKSATVTALFIYSWARHPGPDPYAVLANWEWFGPWVQSKSKQIVDFVGPLGGVVLLAVCLGLLAWRRDRRPEGRTLLLLVPSVCGFLFWFWTAPEPRFLGAQLWLLFVAEAILLVEAARCARAGPSRALLALLFAFLSLPFVAQVRQDSWLLELRPEGRAQNISLDGFQETTHAEVREYRNHQGARIFVPLEDDRCWDAPLPCRTPWEEEFELRDPASLRAGFRAVTAGPP